MPVREEEAETVSDGSLGICVIGAGRAGMIHAGNFAAGRVAGARLAALVDPEPAQLAAAVREVGIDCAFADYRQALDLDAVDAVVIASPTVSHRDICIAAAEAGKHILCEKPMAMDAEQCREMLAAVESAGVKLQIGFMRRFDRGFMDAKKYIDAGEIGDVVAVKSMTHGPSIPKPWMYDLSKSNGPLAEVNSHDIDTLRWFTGSEFSEVYAIGGNYRCVDARESFPDFYDNVILAATFVNGMQGSISGAQGVGYGYDSRCEVLGQVGLITVGTIGRETTAVYRNRDGRTDIVGSWRDLFASAYLEEDQEFVDCIRADREPRADGRDGLEAVRVVNAGNASIREGRPVKIPH